MRAFAGLAGVVAACYAPSPPSGVPCDPATSRCPAGQACVLQAGAYVCSGTSGSSPDASHDPDGQAPMVCDNATGHDEDLDQVDDACDGCPHLADPMQADADHDGVGDACDPHPGVADRIARFDAFASIPADWTLPAGWSIDSDGLVGTSSSNSAANLDLPLSAEVVVFSHVKMSGTATETNAGVLVNFASSTEFYKCGVHVEPHLELVKFPGMIIDMKALPSAAWLDVDLEARSEAGALRCRAARDGGQVETSGQDSSLSGSRVGVRIREGTARFEYLVVISRRP